MSTVSRRETLRQGLTWGVAAHVGGASAFADEPRPIPIIDTHQHLWDLKTFKLAWLEKRSSLDRSFLPDDYAKATAGLPIDKSIYMEVDVIPEQQVAEAEWILALIRAGKTPTVAAVISGRPASEGFAAYLKRFKNSPEIKGVRQVLHAPTTPPGYCLSDEFIRGIRHLGTLGLSYDLCLRPGELADADKLVASCSETKFILDHCGNGDVRAKDRSPWKRGIDALAKRKSVVCKVSGIVASAKGMDWNADDLAPIVNHVLDAFGPDRVMFGGDWPVCTLASTFRRWVEALQSIVKDRPEVDRRKLFHDNARRVYGLAD